MTEIEKPVLTLSGVTPQLLNEPIHDNEEVNKRAVSKTMDKEALEKMKSLAKQGHTKSQFKLGMHYIEQDDCGQGMRWLERASAMGDMQGLYQLAIMHYDGIGTLPNLTKGVELLKEVSSSTDVVYQHLVPHAQYSLGMAAFMGYGMKQEDSAAEHYWLLAGKEGDPDGSVAAQSQLGMFYTRRDTKDVKKAFYWHYFAAENGSLESKGALGVMYYKGVGTAPDRELAFKSLCEASERGSLFAQGNLVVYYYEGRLFTRAAHCAWSIAQTESLEEVAERTGLLIEYIRRGAALGCFYYARCLQTGKGVEKNEGESNIYFKKAIEACPITAADLHQKLNNQEL